MAITTAHPERRERRRKAGRGVFRDFSICLPHLERAPHGENPGDGPFHREKETMGGDVAPAAVVPREDRSGILPCVDDADSDACDEEHRGGGQRIENLKTETSDGVPQFDGAQRIGGVGPFSCRSSSDGERSFRVVIGASTGRSEWCGSRGRLSVFRDGAAALRYGSVSRGVFPAFRPEWNRLFRFLARPRLVGIAASAGSAWFVCSNSRTSAGWSGKREMCTPDGPVGGLPG
ncbi:hypothetical protein [Streptomyces chilikensis]|uniref:Uncharacterized protein n=1 Tax=Streptomyces chilikensis TaxID=1194079 RepID=A0ABV3EMS4_9ACTN